MIPLSVRSRSSHRQPWSLARLLRERAIFLGYSLAASTHLTYDTALASYVEFCNLHQLPLDPTIDTLSFYITFMAHHVKPSTVASYLSGIVS